MIVLYSFDGLVQVIHLDHLLLVGGVVLMGGVWWSARDLMPLLGYARWFDAKSAVERATISADVQGVDVGKNFRDAPEVSGNRGPKRQNYRLTRYAAYLVAMNGNGCRRFRFSGGDAGMWVVLVSGWPAWVALPDQGRGADFVHFEHFPHHQPLPSPTRD